MKTLIVTGLSGAGKSMAIDIIEDAGFFCVDNVPVHLVATFVGLCRSGDSEIEKLAVVTDIRSSMNSANFQGLFKQMHRDLSEVEVLFFEADAEVLVRRYQESRRRHPLLAQAGGLLAAIQLERDQLAPIREQADYIIDTTDLKLADLKHRILSLLEREKLSATIQVKLMSFGYTYGVPISADFIFDARFLPNPFYKKELRHLTGEDRAVRDYVMGFPAAQDYFERLKALIASVIPYYEDVNKGYVEIAVGCTGGQHRSVTFACLLASALRAQGFDTQITHRDIGKDREKR